MRRLRELLLRPLTRKVKIVYFADGDAFVLGLHKIPPRKIGTPAQVLDARMWRWQ